MPKTFSVQADYAAAPDAVLATATDADAVTAKFTALGAHDVEVVSRTDTADGVRIEVTRKQDVDVPGFAKKVLQPTNSIRLVEDWKRTADGAAATWKGRDLGRPRDARGHPHAHPVKHRRHGADRGHRQGVRAAHRGQARGLRGDRDGEGPRRRAGLDRKARRALSAAAAAELCRRSAAS